MANSIVKAKNSVMLSGIDTNWSYDDDYKGGPHLIKYLMFAAAAADELIIRDGGATGPIIAQIVTTAAANERFPIDARVTPYLLVSEQTLNAASVVTFVMDR